MNEFNTFGVKNISHAYLKTSILHIQSSLGSPQCPELRFWTRWGFIDQADVNLLHNYG